MAGLSIKKFLWVAAASSYQIEDDKAESRRPPWIREVFAGASGNAERRDAVDQAFQHSYRSKKDVTLLHILLIQSYRSSISWSPVLPDGEGRPNAAVFNSYDRLVNKLTTAGLRPFATLFHWGLPQVLHERGSFADDYIGSWFRDQEAEANARSGDRGKYWIMVNQPSVYACLGHAPGGPASDLVNLQMFRVQQLNAAQGAALQALRAKDPAWRLGTTLKVHKNFIRQLPVIRRPQTASNPG